MVLTERFDPATDLGRLRSCRQIAAACQQADDPSMPVRSFENFAAWWAGGFSNDPRETWLAADAADGNVAGCYLLTLPERENRAIAMCALYVAPGARRSGRGTELLAHCADRARQAGRSRLDSEIIDGSPGAAFAAAMGATSGIAEVYRQLTVDASLTARLPVLRAAAEQHSGGYAPVSWLGVVPDEYMDDVVRLSAAMADAPRDADVEAEIWDAGRIRHAERTLIETGQRLYTVAAQHVQTGRLAAITQVSTDPGVPGWGFQALTAVLADHRGRRLGLLVKAAMLELLVGDRPDVRRIVTSNAGPNEHMIAINSQLGFEVCSVRRHWDLDLARQPLSSVVEAEPA